MNFCTRFIPFRSIRPSSPPPRQEGLSANFNTLQDGSKANIRFYVSRKPDKSKCIEKADLIKIILTINLFFYCLFI